MADSYLLNIDDIAKETEDLLNSVKKRTPTKSKKTSSVKPQQSPTSITGFLLCSDISQKNECKTLTNFVSI